MYHGTERHKAEAILTHGFDVDRCHPGCILGKGIYASTDYDKARSHGTVVIKLLVYAGKASLDPAVFCV